MVAAPASPAPTGRPKRQHANVHELSEEPKSENKAGALCMRRTQEWLRIRFEHLLPEHFCEGSVLFYTAQLLEAPPGFESVWGGAIGQGIISEANENMCSARAVLLLADLHDKEQLMSVIEMADFVNDRFKEAAPLLIYVPHSVSPELRKPQGYEDSFELFKFVMDNGIDETITGEPEGMKLALEIESRVFVQDSLVKKLSSDPDTPEKQDFRTKRVQFLKEAMHDTVWEYLRVRLQTSVPAIDWNIAPGIPDYIEDYKLDSFLAKGSFGKVFRLKYADDANESTGSVLKVVAKQDMFDLTSLYKVNKQIGVMQVLSSDWPHPNITKLYNVFQSETHIFFELEDSGPMDLYRCCLQREQRQCPFSRGKTQKMIHQLIAAVCHMHTKPKVVHCDLKPENIIVSEAQNNVLLKICDFDTAQINPAIPQHGIVGTFPFSAPEIILEKRFDPYAADMWSLGLVLLELLCFSKVLEISLQLDSGNNAESRQEVHQIRNQMMTKIRGFFAHEEAVCCLLRENVRRDLHVVLSRSLLSHLSSMLKVSSADRIQAGELMQASGLVGTC